MPTPIAPWFRGELSAWVKHPNFPSGAMPRASSPRSTSVKLSKTISPAHRDTSVELWKLLNVVTWWQTYIDAARSNVRCARRSVPLEPAAIAHGS